MKHIFRAILFLAYLSYFAHAQTPSVTVSYAELACLNNVHKIPITLSGAFNADNKFTVQLRESAALPVLNTFPAVLKGQNIEVIYGDSSLSVFPKLQLRIVTSSPKTESNWIDFKVHSKGIIKVSSAISDTVNLGENLLLKFTTQSTTETDVTLSDGTLFEIPPYSQSEFTTFLPVTASKTEPFYIKNATNSCGAMRTLGQVRPVANRTSVRTKSVNFRNSCENSDVKITLATIGPALSPGSQYKVRFRSVSASPNAIPTIAESAAELRDGVIVTRIPNLGLTAKQDFNLIIVSDEQKIVGAPGNVTLSIYPKPAVSFYTPNVDINIGEKTRVGVIFKGVPPFFAELGDGSSITASYSGEVYLEKSPDKTTTYELKSMTSGCGVTNLPNKENMTVSVKTGIFLVPESYPNILCAGAKAKVRIRSNGNIGSNTTYMVNAYYGPSKEYRFPAIRNGDYLEFTIPELPAETSPEMLYDGLNNLYVTSENPRLKSAPNYTYLIQSKPQLVSKSSEYTLDEPGIVQLSYTLYGKWPFTIEDEKGNLITVKNDWWAPEVYLDKTKDFKIKSISNSCYKNDKIPATRLTLTNNTAPGLYLEPVVSRVCGTDSLEINILAPGKFSEDNVFQIQAYADCCNFATLKTVRSGGTYKVKIPASQNGYIYPVSIKVSSTNPFLSSKTYQFTVDLPLKDFRVNPAGTQSVPALLTNSSDPTITFSATGGGVTALVYSDGNSERKVAFDEPHSLGIKIAPVSGQTTVYTLKSITNSCGTQPANLSTYVKLLPFEIKLNDFDFTMSRFCSGNPISVPFAIENGKSANATFALELSREDELSYRTIASGESSKIITATIPEDISQGYYKFRIVSSDRVASNSVRIFIGVTPGAIISSKLPQPISWNSSAPLDLDLNFTGTEPWTAIFENNTSLTTNINPALRRVTLSEGGFFELKTVYNECGYGKVSGTVLVNVTARLDISAQSYAACNGKIFTVDYRLTGDADLSSDYIRFELIDPLTSKSIQLDSTRTKSGKIDLKLPANLTGDFYKIRCTVRKAELSSQFDVAMTRPAEIILSGSTVINSGEQTQLVLQSGSTIAETVNYQLSDGTKGVYYAPGDTFISVSPNKTTTYTITSVSNSCGAGKGTGSATVEVNQPGDKSVSVTGYYSPAANFCIGDSIHVNFTKTGTFSAGNVMAIQLSDSTGKNFKSIPTTGISSPLRALLPPSLIPGKYYRIRITASDPGTASGAFHSPLVTWQKAGAQFASNVVEYRETTEPVIAVNFSGSGPWRYELGTDNSQQTRYSLKSVDSVYIQQAAPGQTYRLLNVYGLCGPGTVGAISTVTVSLITSEPGTILPEIKIGPNPTQDFLQIRFNTASIVNIILLDIRGTLLMEKKVRSRDENFDLRALTPGTYLLQIEGDGKKSVFRVVKR
ncbi:T9SS type A sorting domain-containing protein [Dyadobacter diqingensis]|uniref:T9SS type A sorting domain-containing protein n=1 Tax=Dyadobacter diqingensis TaxID=2938121 RepID=UPI0020C1A964|nr:T9SS type A sorting domain-containing protein [Dyadobacter diqingensis]